jgi:DNA-binding response OmpR family regulator
MVVEYLQEHFSIIYQAGDGAEALATYYDKQPDIIITDIEMPKINGLEFTQKIRENDDTTPILITTAFTTTEYLLKAVELNLVKYLVKPIAEETLLETLELSFQKIESRCPTVVWLSPQHRYDTYNHTLTYDKSIIKLTLSQIKLLDILIENRNRAVSYQEIENYIWSEKAMSSAAIRSLVNSIRTIINKETIQNVPKIGYKIKLYE